MPKALVVIKYDQIITEEEIQKIRENFLSVKIITENDIPIASEEKVEKAVKSVTINLEIVDNSSHINFCSNDPETFPLAIQVLAQLMKDMGYPEAEQIV